MSSEWRRYKTLTEIVVEVEKDVLEESEDTIVVDVTGLTKRHLQFLFDLSGSV